MTGSADLHRIIGDVMRLGTIASIDHADATCTVAVGEIVTGAIPWLTLRAGGTTRWSPPTVAEQVLLLCPEGDTAAGLVVCGLYSDANPAPGDRDKLDLVRFADGAEISYDAEAHALVATFPEEGTVTVTAPGGVTITAEGGVTIVAADGVSIDAEAGVTIIGDVDITGTVTVTEDVVANGISLTKHKHGQVQAGAAKTAAGMIVPLTPITVMMIVLVTVFWTAIVDRLIESSSR